MKSTQVLILMALITTFPVFAEGLRQRAQNYFNAHAIALPGGVRAAQLPGGGAAATQGDVTVAATANGGTAIAIGNQLFAQRDGHGVYAAPGIIVTEKGMVWCPPGPTCTLYSEEGAVQIPRP